MRSDPKTWGRVGAKKCKLAQMPALLPTVRTSALALVATGCSAGAAFLTVPMTRTTPAPDASAEESDAGGRSASRALPAEPTPPGLSRACRRDVTCRPEEDGPTAPRAFPPPFERCAEITPSGAAFSARETMDARRDDAHACCYVGFVGCAR